MELASAISSLPEQALIRCGSNDSYSDHAPRQFICPISSSIMRDPVLASDGESYELAQIRTLFSRHDKSNPETPRVVSPITAAFLDHAVFRNNALRRLIDDWIVKEGGRSMSSVPERTKILLKCGPRMFVVPDEEEYA